MQMQTIWYVLIHVSLGLIGWKIFTITNQGVLAAAVMIDVRLSYLVFLDSL